uniref:Uncharacterized protein n=1 Tax=Arundo donax TaxID=35708 RepID=A0A0A8Y060_ARUDO
MQHASGVLDNHFHYPEIILKSGKDQEEEQQQQQKVADRRSAGLEELKIACQSTSTEGGASTQSEETQGPYQYWPPDFNQDQHG